MIKVGKFKLLNKRSLKYGSNSLLLIAIVVAMAVIVNLLVGMGDFKLDLTKDKIYSLSDESKKAIKDIKKDVTIYGLFDDGQVPSGSQYKEILNLLGEYKQLGIKVTYIDPDKDPGTITKFDKDGTKGIAKGDFVVVSGNKVKRLDATELYGQSSDYGRLYSAEPLITGAIKFVTSDVTPVAYFVEGHNEYSISSDLTQIRTVLENNNLESKSLSLATVDKIPDDCKVLIFASPKKDLTEDEKIKVNAYLKKNGNIAFLFDPIETSEKLSNFEEVLKEYNIGINYDKIKELDDSRHLPSDEYAIITTPEDNDINKAFSGKNYQLFFTDVRSLSILKNAKDWITTTSLIKSSEKAEGASVINQGTTEKGPFDLAIASEISGSSKILAFGNGSFLTDAALQSQYGQYYANGANYFLTTVINWMQGKTDDSAVSAKLITQKALTATATQSKVIAVVLIGVLPLLIMVWGFVVWSRRRHL